MKKSGRRSKKLSAVAAATSLALVSGTLPASLAFAQGNGKKGAPTAKDAADAGTRVPEQPAGARRLGLRDALKVAVRQNPTLASSTVDVDIANAQVAETYGLEDWVLDAQASGSATHGEPTLASPFLPKVDDKVALGVGITKGLADGGTIGLRFDGSVGRNENFFSTNGPQTLWSPSATLSFTQPILRGFGERNRAVNGVTRAGAEVNRDAKTLDRQNTAANVVRDVVQAYWDLAYAAQEVEIRKSSLALAREQLRITQAGIDVGKLAKTESLAVEQAIAAREQELLLSEQQLSEKAIDLRRLIGMEIGPGEIDLFATDRLETGATDPDLDRTLKAAMANNPQLLSVRALGKSAYITVAVTENGLLPTLDFKASAGPTGLADSAGDAMDQFVHFDAYNAQASLNFSMNLGNDLAKGATEVARANLRKVKLNEQDIAAQIAAAVVRAVNSVKFAKKRMDVSAKATQLAAQNVDLEKARWEVGRTTNFEVLKRQDELAQSQLAEARARADYLKAVSVLDSLTGDILPRYGIELAKK